VGGRGGGVTGVGERGSRKSGRGVVVLGAGSEFLRVFFLIEAGRVTIKILPNPSSSSGGVTVGFSLADAVDLRLLLRLVLRLLGIF
jgi:hypothetical protein